MFLVPASVRAHGDSPDVAVWGSAALIIGLAAAYALGACRIWRSGLSRGVHAWQVACFGLGGAALAVALLGPIESLAERSFAAHMGQHMLLIAVAAPLLVVGAPIAVFGALLSSTSLKAIARGSAPAIVGRPLLAFALHAAFVWAWHAPALFEAALRSEALHLLEHITLLASALYFWWSLLHAGRARAGGFGTSALLALATMMHTGFLGALITFARRPLYAVYVQPGVDALADQQLAGLLMWIPGALVYLVAGLVLIGAWLGRAQRSTRAAPASVAR